MAADVTQSPDPSGAGLGPPGLTGVWLLTLSAGLVTSLAAAAGWARLDAPRWPEKSDPLGPSIVVLLAGSAASLGVATAATVVAARARGRLGGGRLGVMLWRGLAVWAAALAAGGVATWEIAQARDRDNHARTAAAIVGTWYQRGVSDVAPRYEVTFHPDGRYESTSLTGPAHERTTHRGRYRLSENGRRIDFGDRAPPPGAGPASWMWNIEFSGLDQFRKWSRVWHYTATDVYERKR